MQALDGQLRVMTFSFPSNCEMSWSYDTKSQSLDTFISDLKINYIGIWAPTTYASRHFLGVENNFIT